MHTYTYWTQGDIQEVENTVLTSSQRWRRKDQDKSQRRAITSCFLYFTLDKMIGTQRTDPLDTVAIFIKRKSRQREQRNKNRIRGDIR